MPHVEKRAAMDVFRAANAVASEALAANPIAVDVELGMQLLQQFEPPVQHALAALFHKLHHAKQADKKSVPPVLNSDSVPTSDSPASTEAARPEEKESLMPSVPDNFESS